MTYALKLHSGRDSDEASIGERNPGASSAYRYARLPGRCLHGAGNVVTRDETTMLASGCWGYVQREAPNISFWRTCYLCS